MRDEKDATEDSPEQGTKRPQSTYFFSLLSQAKPMLNFQTDYDEATGEQVLTCFLLPQMEFQQENMGKQLIVFLKVR